MDVGPRAASREVGRLVEAFGRPNVAVELWDHGDPLDTARNDALALVAAEWGIDPVATNNVHYATPAGFRLASTLAAIRARRPLAELEGWLPAAPAACLRARASSTGASPAGPGWSSGRPSWAWRCAFDLRLVAPRLPDFPVPEGMDEMGYLRQLVDPGRARALRATPRRAGAGRLDPDRARARGHRRPGVRRLLPDRVGHRPVLPPPRHLLPGPGIGRQLGRLLRPRGHQRRRRRPRVALRALLVPGPGRPAGHRRGHRVRSARGGHPVRVRAVRAPPRGTGGQRHHLPPSLGRARRGQGLRVQSRAGRRVGGGDRPGQPGAGVGRGSGGGGRPDDRWAGCRWRGCRRGCGRRGCSWRGCRRRGDPATGGGAGRRGAGSARATSAFTRRAWCCATGR